MQHLIEQFLIQHKYCPLPKIGTLELKQRNADFSVGEQLIAAPAPFIALTSVEKDSAAFVSFIAKQKNIDNHQAGSMLQEYCTAILNIKNGQEMAIAEAGSMSVNSKGELQFKQRALPQEFLPKIALNRVVHPEAVHQVRVGDEEKTTAYMHGYLKDAKVKKGNQWLMFFLVIMLLLLTVIVHYVTDNTNTSNDSKESNQHPPHAANAVY